MRSDANSAICGAASGAYSLAFRRGGSFTDYAMPRASDAPALVTAFDPVPAKTNPLGVKGCGEAGYAGALVCIVNAAVDALCELGVRHLDMPLTPMRVWQAIQAARADSSNPT